MIRVVTKQPGMANPAKVEQIQNTLDAKQALVSPRGKADSLIERVYAPEFEEHGIEVYCNEEGLFDSGCTPNIEVGEQMLQGPVFFTSHNTEGEAVSLTDSQVAFVQAKLQTVVQSIF